MAKKPRFTPSYDPEATGHLDAIELKYHSLIRSTIAEQLRSEPEIETRNRKPLERPIIAGARWELWDRATASASSIEWMTHSGRFASWALA